jgi:hypothetical protein
MAYLAPSAVPKPGPTSGHARELETLDILKRRLPADYTVFHGVHWSRGWAAQAAFGEADFIVVNEAGNCLVVEQKCGALAEGKDGVGKAYDGKVKSIGEQLHRTMDGLRDKFKRQVGHKLQLDYLLYCPDHRIANLTAAGLDKERIVDATLAMELPRRITELLPASPASDHGRRVRMFFEQTLDLVPDIHARVAQGDRAFAQASGGLAETLSNISGRPLRLRVRGTAGCGKSIVAVKAYQDAVLAGKRPLLLCFNRPLKEKMKASVSGGGVVETWYGVLAEVLKATGRELLMGDNGPDWDRATDEVISGAITDEWKFDTVIVDEGQDFDPDWGEIIDLFAAPGAERIWLDDPDQSIQYGRDPSSASWPPEAWTGYRARCNYRSPASVSAYIKQLLPEFTFEAANPMPGLGVGVSSVTAPEQTPHAVGKIVDDLLKRGFVHDDIVVLSLRGLSQATLANSARAGNHSLARFTGSYDLFGNQIWTKGQLRFDTIRRYKGQQAPAVILTDVTPASNSGFEEKGSQWRRLLFVALTRATQRIDVVAQEGSPGFRELVSV